MSEIINTVLVEIDGVQVRVNADDERAVIKRAEPESEPEPKNTQRKQNERQSK